MMNEPSDQAESSDQLNQGAQDEHVELPERESKGYGEASQKDVKQPLPASREPQVRGLGYVWMIASTVCFVVLILTPLLSFLALVVSLCTSGLIALSLDDSAVKGTGAGALLGMLGGLIVPFVAVLVASMSHALSAPEEGSQTQTSATRRIIAVASCTVLVFMGLAAMAGPTELGFGLMIGVIYGGGLIAGVGTTWYGGKFSWNTLVRGLRRARHAPFAAGMWSALSTALSVAVVAGGFVAWNASPELRRELLGEWIDKLDAAFKEPQQGPPAVESSAQQETPAEEVVVKRPPTLSTTNFNAQAQTSNDLRNECFDELANRPDVQRSQRRKEIGRLMRKFRLSWEDSEDIVSTAILSVCVRHGEEPVRHLVPYFKSSVNNKFVTMYARTWSRECSLNGVTDTMIAPPPEGLLHVKEVMCHKLSVQEQDILELAAKGYTSSEIAHAFDVSAVTARQRLSRARKHFKAELDRN